MRKKSVRPKAQSDKSLLFMIFGFLIFGLLMIANSTVISSKNLYGDPYRFVILQLGWVLIGLIGFFIFYKIDYKNLSLVAYLFLIASLVFLILLAIVSLFPCSGSFGFAPCINGANRWVYLNPPPLPEVPFLGVLGFQPGELAKISIILYLSVQLSRNIKDEDEIFWVYLVTAGLLSFLILMQPNMSTAAIVFGLGTILYFVSGASLKPLFIAIPLIIGLVLTFIMISPYRRSRLMTLVRGDESVESQSGYHIKQALVALGSGGITGVGLGQSKQKFQYLPEVASDSIFAIIGEELGLLGTVGLVSAFLYFVYKGFSVARNAPDLLGKLLATGVTSWIGIQFFVNVGAMTKLIPLTGVPMPLISYGGSSMVFSLMGLGILANISKK